MAATIFFCRYRHSCCRGVSVFLLMLLLLLSSDPALVFGSTIPRTKSLSAMVSPENNNNIIHRLDLSYLHRCGVADIANAIRGALKEQQNRNRNTSTPKLEDDEEGDSLASNTAATASATSTNNILDIDLTASLIGKNISEILSSFLPEKSPADLQSNNDDAVEEYTEFPSSMMVKLTARRNQLSPGEVTAVLEFLLKNGPANETTLAPKIDEGEEEDEKESSPLMVGDKDSNPSSETEPAIAATEHSDQGETKSNDNDVESDIDGDGQKAESSGEVASEAAIGFITKTRLRPAFVSIESLDLGWNNLGGGGRRAAGVRSLNLALRKLLAEAELCPRTIRLNVCGLGPPACRDLAKGIVERYRRHEEVKSNDDNPMNDSLLSSPPPLPPPLSLDLACNQGIGDVGVAALAAAIRTVTRQESFGSPNNAQNEKTRKRRRKRRTPKQDAVQEGEESPLEEEKTEETNTVATDQQNTDPTTAAEPKPTTRTILERLDLSGCDIGDAGAEALAIALTNQPLCVKHLDLSNNRITDQGAAALAEVLEDNGFVESLDLSHNKDLGDNGAKKLALAFQRDGIARLILRSCNIRADGAASFGSALQSVMSRTTKSSSASNSRVIDLSGNPLGILSKKKKSGSKYSATALRSKATDTTKAYMNIIGKSLQKGLNSISGEGGGADTLESDDEEEGRMGGEFEDADESVKKCGALSFAEAFIRAGERESESNQEAESDGIADPVRFELGLRHCSFDTRAAEALAAVLQESKEKYPGTKLSLDMTMNHVLEEDIVAALHGEEGYDDQLTDMADVYLDALEVMRESRERALKAVQMAAARARAQAVEEASWGAVPPPTSSKYSDDDGDEWSNNVEDDEDWDYERNSEEEYSEEKDFW